MAVDFNCYTLFDAILLIPDLLLAIILAEAFTRWLFPSADITKYSM